VIGGIWISQKYGSPENQGWLPEPRGVGIGEEVAGHLPVCVCRLLHLVIQWQSHDTVLFVSDVVRNLLSQKKQIAVSFNQLKKESFSRSIFSMEFSESDSQNGRELKQKKFSRLKLCRHCRRNKQYTMKHWPALSVVFSA